MACLACYACYCVLKETALSIQQFDSQHTSHTQYTLATGYPTWLSTRLPRVCRASLVLSLFLFLIPVCRETRLDLFAFALLDFLAIVLSITNEVLATRSELCVKDAFIFLLYDQACLDPFYYVLALQQPTLAVICRRFWQYVILRSHSFLHSLQMIYDNTE